MTDRIFDEMKQQMTPDDELVAGLFARFDAEQGEVGSAPTQSGNTSTGATSASTQPAHASVQPAHTSAKQPLTPTQSSTVSTRFSRRSAKWGKRMEAIAACLIVVVLVASIFGISNLQGWQSSDTSRTSQGQPRQPGRSVSVNPESYPEIYDTLTAFQLMHYGYGYATGAMGSGDGEIVQMEADMASSFVNTTATSNSAREEAAYAPAPAFASNTGDSLLSQSTDSNNYSGDYSGTNVQVKGIDEGDIVKTDGRYIYLISDQEVIILAAQGAETDVCSRFEIPFDPESFYSQPRELFIYGDTLVVLSSSYENIPWVQYEDENVTGESSTSEQYVSTTDEEYTTYASSDFTTATLYDVSDRSNPSLITQISQSGYYHSARLQGSMLYLLSNYYIHQYGSMRNEPCTYVPMTIVDARASLMPLEDIHIFPYLQGPTYAVISSIDLEQNAIVGQKTVLGGGEVLYMSYDNIYLAVNETAMDQSEPYEISVYTVIDTVYSSKTHLAKFALNDGDLTFAAEAELSGNLLNQFSLDEYEGNLRVALTTNTYAMREMRDDSQGIVDYRYLDKGDEQSNSVYVLGPDLTVLGCIEGLAEEERIYSVRFSGDVGYVVTFRQVDPLFTLDLSDPAHPTVQGALEIPGFSTYLHPYAPGRLLGLGFDSDGQRAGCLKLSMFDVTDPYNVVELHTMYLESYYAEAAYNHRAILVDPTRDMIGFAAEITDDARAYYATKYMVFGYSDEAGFYERAMLTFAEEAYTMNARGLYIDDSFYVSSPYSLDVFSLPEFERLVAIELNDVDFGYSGRPVPIQAFEVGDRAAPLSRPVEPPR